MQIVQVILKALQNSSFVFCPCLQSITNYRKGPCGMFVGVFCCKSLLERRTRRIFWLINCKSCNVLLPVKEQYAGKHHYNHVKCEPCVHICYIVTLSLYGIGKFQKLNISNWQFVLIFTPPTVTVLSRYWLLDHVGIFNCYTRRYVHINFYE